MERELTKAEEQIMQILWDLGNAVVHDIIYQLPEPKPAYNTVSTIVRILEAKGFVDHETEGRGHRYFPIIDKEEYTKTFMNSFTKRFFGSSFKDLVSFFAKEDQIDLQDLEDILTELRQENKD